MTQKTELPVGSPAVLTHLELRGPHDLEAPFGAIQDSLGKPTDSLDVSGVLFFVS